jgi:hypothetical protein
VGWDAPPGDLDLTRALRGALFAGLGVLGGDPDVNALARQIELRSRAGGATDPSLASAAVSVIASTGGAEEYEGFLEAMRSATTPQEELRYLFGLADFRDADLLARTLEMTSTDAVRSQDVPQVFMKALMNRDQGSLAWSFVRDRWDAIVARLTPSTVVYVAYGVRALVEPGLVRDVQSFFEEHDIPQSALQLRQILEIQRVNATFAARARGELEEMFGG